MGFSLENKFINIFSTHITLSRKNDNVFFLGVKCTKDPSTFLELSKDSYPNKLKAMILNKYDIFYQWELVKTFNPKIKKKRKNYFRKWHSNNCFYPLNTRF